VSTKKLQFMEAVLGIVAGLAGSALWFFATLASSDIASSGALLVVLSYLWLVLIFAALTWIAHHAEKYLTRNIVAILGCILFLLNTTCWVGFRFGWFRIGG